MGSGFGCHQPRPHPSQGAALGWPACMHAGRRRGELRPPRGQTNMQRAEQRPAAAALGGGGGPCQLYHPAYCPAASPFHQPTHPPHSPASLLRRFVRVGPPIWVCSAGAGMHAGRRCGATVEALGGITARRGLRLAVGIGCLQQSATRPRHPPFCLLGCRQCFISRFFLPKTHPSHAFGQPNPIAS